MSIETHAQENLTVRRMCDADIAAAMRLKEAEGWNQTEADWRFFKNRNPELCLVACRDERVIGTVTAINYNNQVVWIGMMLIARQSRGRGMSRRLLNAVLQALDGGLSVKLDATPAGMPVYGKLDFIEELEIHRLTTTNLQAPRAVDYAGVLQRVAESDISEIMRFDQSVFGADRSELISFLVKNLPGHAWVAKRDGRIAGFALGRVGTRFQQIGPVSAESEVDAKVLISQIAKDLIGRPLVIDVLADKPELTNWLSQLGFSRKRVLYRMYRNHNSYPGDVKRQFAIAGPEFG